MAPQNGKSVCDAHEFFSVTLIRVQETTEKIGDEVAEGNVRNAKLEITVENLVDKFNAFCTESEKSRNDQLDRIDRLYDLMREDRKKSKWRPAHFVALAGSFFGAAGIVLAAWITRGVKS